MTTHIAIAFGILLALFSFTLFTPYRKLFVAWCSALNSISEAFDALVNDRRSIGKQGWFKARGHSGSLSFLVALVLLFTIFGPTLSPLFALFDGDRWAGLFAGDDRMFLWNVGAFLLYVTLLVALGALERLSMFAGLRLQWLHVALIVTASTFVVLLPGGFLIEDPEGLHTEASGAPYSHALAYFSGVFAVVALLASRVFAHMTIGELIREPGYRKTAREMLENLRLSDERPEPPDPSKSRVFHAWFMVPFRTPTLLFLFPSFLVLLWPTDFTGDRSTQFAVLAYGVLGTISFLAAGNYYSEWQMMATLAQRRFARGGSLLISVLVILLAAAYMLNVSYVTTLLQGLGWTVTLYILAAYVFVWLYDYWALRVWTTCVLRLFDDPDASGEQHDWQRTFTPREAGQEYAMRLVGRSRFSIGPPDSRRAARYLTPTLFAKLEGGQLGPASRRLRDSVLNMLGNYQASLHSALAFTVAAVVIVGVSQQPDPMHVVEATDAGDDPRTCDGERKFIECFLEDDGEGPVIAIAASGGGTRAALFTTSLLHGLEQSDLIDRVRLMSGVSGGSASLAYFTANHGALERSAAAAADGFRCPSSTPSYGQRVDERWSAPWACFYRAMSTPFIADVLNGVSEWRIFGGKPNGLLLAESLQRQFGDPVATLASASNPGLILNSTLVGHSWDASRELARRFCERGMEPTQCAADGRAYTVHAGSRLVFTNLAVDQNVIRQHNLATMPGTGNTLFPFAGTDVAPDVHLKYAVINDGSLSLPFATAMSANFPPVFSDVHVQVNNANEGPAGGNRIPVVSRYWVTDGGVADNRGVVSLLFAIKRGVQVLESEGRAIPDIHVVVAEASYANIDYARTRGVAAALGSAAPFASQLMLSLLEDIEREIGDRIHLHYLKMPMALRSRGGLGTHWMLPRSVLIWNPYVEDTSRMRDNREEFSRNLSRPQLLDVIAALHDNHLASCSQRVSQAFAKPNAEVTEWICDGSHARRWCDLVERTTGRSGEACGAPAPARRSIATATN